VKKKYPPENQTWLAGESTILLMLFIINTSIFEGFPIAMFDYWKVS